MKRFLLVGILAVVAMAPLFAQNATITQVTGKVQIQAPGGAWTDAGPGTVVMPGTFISTGFNSTAVLDLGTAQIQVKPLTRMKLSELERSQGTVTTSVFLTVGAVHANVANNLGITQNFAIQSPVSTAAVRGTIFDFDGFSLTVDRGIVHLFTPDLLGRDVAAGQSSRVNGPYVPGSAEAFQAAATNIDTHTNPNGSGGTPQGGAGHGSTGTFNIVITGP